MSKVGRNQRCPCGSGEKYKNCCLQKDEEERRNIVSQSNFQSWILSNRPEEVVSKIACLHLFPENQTHLIRLERAVQIASVKYDPGISSNHTITADELKYNLHNANELNELIESEDPLEGLFTENITFYDGNYIVYPGITPKNPSILENLLKAAFFHGKEALPKRFWFTTGQSVLALFVISNIVAKRMGHKRWMYSPNDPQKPIYIPDNETLQSASDAVTFQENELYDILHKAHVVPESIKPFIGDIGHREFHNSDFNNHPLQMCPILKIDKICVLAQPASILTAIRHRVIENAIKGNCIKELANLYHLVTWSSTCQSLSRMGYEDENLSLPDWNSPMSFSENVFRIDCDKICYVQKFTDNLIAYDEKRPFGNWNADAIVQKLNLRRKEIAEYIQKNNTGINKLLVLVVVDGVGRYMFAGLAKKNPKYLMLSFDSEELDVLSKLGNHDKLDLWKFATSENNFRKMSKLTSWSTLDTYAFYCEHQRSFSLSDELAPTLLILDGTYGREYRRRSRMNSDAHCALHTEKGRFELVVRLYSEDDSEIPIYFSPHSEFHPEFLIESYPQPIWVRPKFAKSERVRENFQEYINMAETISYWLWQLSQGFSEYLNGFINYGPLPISVVFSFEDPIVWFSSKRVDIHKPNDDIPTLKFNCDNENRTIEFELPIKMLPALYRPDNSGERKLVECLIRSLNTLISCELGDEIISEDSIPIIVERTAPLGVKKKTIYLDSAMNPELIEGNLPRWWDIQQHNISAQMDELAWEINKKVKNQFSEGEVLEDRYKEFVETILKIYLERFRTSISSLSAISLLKRLFEMNEAAIHKGSFLTLTGPTIAACFTGIERRSKSLSEQLPAIDRTSITLRFLIEFVSAEPPNGEKSISDSHFDEIIAIAYEYINWGFLADEIRCRVYDHKLAVLPNGRVGTDQNRKNALADFLKASTHEKLENATENFERIWFKTIDHEKDRNEPPQEFAEAFEAEFGVSLKSYALVIGEMMNIGFLMKENCPTMDKELLLGKIRKQTGISESIIDRVITRFSISPRTSWDSIPSGFSTNDILPFRYKRRLSLIHRPIVIMDKLNSPIDCDNLVIWGPRLLKKASWNLINMICNGQYPLKNTESKEMGKLRGKIINERGKEFETVFAQWSEENTLYKILKNLPIKPGKFFNAEKDLGDIDVMLLDENEMTMYCAECKDVDMARNPVEMSQEMDQYIRGNRNKPDKKSRVQMHLSRMEWLIENWSQVKEKLNIQNGQWKIVPFMLTSKEIPGVYMTESPIPFISISLFKREKTAAFADLKLGKEVFNVS